MFFNYILDNNIIFYSIFAGTAGFISYKFVSSYLNSFHKDIGVQTEAWEDYSDRPSQLAFNSSTSLDTVTPLTSPTDYICQSIVQTTPEVGTQTITDGGSSVTTVLPIPPVNIEIIPNPDIVNISDVNTIYLSKIQEISQLYPKELYDAVVTQSDLNYLIKSFTIEQLSASSFNEYVLLLINCFSG